MHTETTHRDGMLAAAGSLIEREASRIVSLAGTGKIVVYGAGARGIVLHEALKSLGRDVEYFIDSNESLYGATCCGHAINNPLALMYEEPSNLLVAIAVASPEQPISRLKDLGLDESKNMTPVFDARSIGDGIAVTGGMSLIDFFLGFNRAADLPGFERIEADGSEDALTIMALGGSTTDPAVMDPLEWRDPALRAECRGSWPRFLQKELALRGVNSRIYNGGMSSYVSGQELLKLIRDGIPLRPDLVIVYDGINDAQPYLFHSPEHPKHHAYFKVMERSVAPLVRNSSIAAFGGQASAPFVEGVCYGVPCERSAAMEWHANQRAMKAVCEEFGMPFISFLQPAGTWLRSYRESCNFTARTQWLVWSFFIKKSVELLEFAGESYREEDGAERLQDILSEHLFMPPKAVADFYKEARSLAKSSDWIVDLVGFFDGKPEIFYDSIHCTVEGNKLLASRICEELLSRGLPSGILAGKKGASR